MYIVKAFVLKC